MFMENFGNVDFAFTGHAHGGQFRIPFLNLGFVAINQGFFPKYTAGIKYSKNGRTGVLISRGIGNTNIPIRLFNPSEVTFFKLKVKGKK